MDKLNKRSDDGDAFIPESAQKSGTSDGVAELLAEQYLRDASGDGSDETIRDEEVPEELGGPFVETRADEEFGATGKPAGVGLQNHGRKRRPNVPFRDPLPRAVGPLAVAGPDENSGNAEAVLGLEKGSRLEPVVTVASPTRKRRRLRG